MSRIAFFDFDGTVTFKDTLLEFIKYYKGEHQFYSGMALNSPYLVAYKLNLISNQLAKEKVLRYFFGGLVQEKFQKLCDEFAFKVIPGLIRPKALNEIKKLQQAGFEVVIISASGENWVRKWCESVGAKWIATQLEIIDNNITGKILGSNCHGEEKVRRINESYDLRNYSEIYCYGDTEGDKPFLSLATFAFYKPFR